jgi:hypothetical protein
VNASREGARVGTLQFEDEDAGPTEAAAAARRYIAASLDVAAASIATDVGGDGGACPEQSSCVRITYDTGGGVTGFLGSLVPTSIVAYAEMRK